MKTGTRDEQAIRAEWAIRAAMVDLQAVRELAEIYGPGSGYAEWAAELQGSLKRIAGAWEAQLRLKGGRA